MMLDNNKHLINEAVCKVLNELKTTSSNFGCLMLMFDVTKTWWDELQDLVDEKDVTRVNGTYGREKYKDAHVTIMYGFHADLKLTDLMGEVLTKPVKTIRPTEITYFSGDEYDVVKLTVDYVFLRELNKVCKKYPHTSQFRLYKPHMTICYVKKGTGKKYAQKLNSKLLKTLKPSEFCYSDKNMKKTKFDFK